MSKPLIFISHITEEKFVAKELQIMLEDAFIGSFAFFVSSDPNILRVGSESHRTIFENLKKASAAVIVTSPKSKKREWINFEAGAAWGRDIPVIPACHSGLEIVELGFPLQALQAADLTNEDSVRSILITLAGLLDLRVPNYDLSSFLNKIRKYSFESTIGNQLINFIREIESINLDYVDLLKKQHTKIYINVDDVRELKKVVAQLEEPFRNQVELENLGNTRMDGYGSETKYKISVNPKLTRKLEELNLI